VSSREGRITAREGAEEPAIAMTDLKKDWTLNADAFRQFLHWLDEGVDSSGEKYLEMRHRLALYFDRRNCLSPDELADETLNRVARKLEEKGAITDVSPAHYCYIVAKFVFLEYMRLAKQGQASLDEVSASDPPVSSSAAFSATADEIEARERLLDCLEGCLHKLQASDRELILEYYRGEQRAKIGRRSQLAARFGLSMNALSIRACRIRNKLELCVRTCSRET
jgi:DNA-directed RNA polymerase specialized sigma24 family protein